MFNFFDLLPGADITSALAVILISVFFVTSADSGAFVIDNIATQGKEGSPVWQRLFWALLLGVTAGTLMSTGGLAALQSMTLIAALPFAFIMVLLCLGLCRGLVADKEHSARRLSPATDFWNGKQWRTRMDHLLRPSTEQEARAFVDKVALPALTALSQEFAARGITSRVEEDGPDQCHLLVPQQGRRDFCYGVRIEARPAPAFNPLEAAHNHDPEARIFEPITYFADGRAGYDIQYLTRDELSADVLRQYERYLVLSQDEGQDLLSSAPEHTQPTQGE
ncbi:BCCT family transporter [Aeromonas caviae]|uniref:BCCT family transporter n=1 Tax=Aeromonas caviae TaxID=648 RepID=UPI0038D24AFF